MNAVGIPATFSASENPAASQFGLEQRGALVLLVAEFGEFPDLARDVAVMGGGAIHLRQDRRLVVGLQSGGSHEEKQQRFA